MVFFASAAYGFDHDHKLWNETLAKYLDAKGMVKYRALKADAKDARHAFTRYLKELENVPRATYDGWNAGQQQAFLINAYNAFTVRLILDNYPVKSIKKIGGLFTKPWSVKFFKLLGGEIQALDPIEHEWLRPKFKDYRIHAAVNCASYSCPPLRRTAFTAAGLSIQLDEQMKIWLSDPERNQLGGEPLKLSKIFDWYGKDFEQWGGGVLKVVAKHAPQPPAGKNIKFLDYNWDLNESP